MPRWGLLSLLLIIPLLGQATSLPCRTPMGPFGGILAVTAPPTIDPSSPGITTCLAIASHASSQTGTADRYLFDGENTQLQLAGLWSLGDGWEIGAQLPWVSWGEGVLDGVIDGWHSVFGLPDGIRDDVPRGQLNVEYERFGVSQGALREGGGAIGDVGVMVARRLHERSDGRGATWVSLRGELPTGDLDRLTGSDGVDVALTAHWHREAPFAVERLRVQAHGGVARLGGDRILGARVEPWAGFGGGTLDLRVGPRVSVGAGLDFRSSLVDAEVSDLGGLSGALHVGVAIRPAPRHTVRFGFTEDVLVSTQPDVVFRLQWTRHPASAGTTR